MRLERCLRISVEYEGTPFHGWQSQPNKRNTIQSILEKTLKKILSHKTSVTGCGRTDSGVHALEFTASFRTTSAIAVDKLRLALNALLPAQIAVTGVREAGRDFNALSASRSKVYRYLILNRPYPSALLEKKAYFCHFPLDIGKMRRAASHLIGTHDFKAFCASGSTARTTTRTVKRLAISRVAYDPLFLGRCPAEKQLLAIDIEADGFLYNMVRNIVGTLLEVGRGRIPCSRVKGILSSKNRIYAGPTAPACGLYLREARY